MQHVFIVGSKGIPGAYGGYETFVDKLTEYHENSKELKYSAVVSTKKTLKEINDYFKNLSCIEQIEIREYYE